MRQGAGARASLDAALHHAVLAASPAGACLVTLKDQGGLDLVKLLEQPPVLVIPASDAELTAKAIGAGAVIHTRAVLGRGRVSVRGSCKDGGGPNVRGSLHAPYPGVEALPHRAPSAWACASPAGG